MHQFSAALSRLFRRLLKCLFPGPKQVGPSMAEKDAMNNASFIRTHGAIGYPPRENRDPLPLPASEGDAL